MAVIHETTLTPTKLELIAGWLPGRPWYLGAAGGQQAEPQLARAGGFRLDDPEGEVGIEFAAVLDSSGERPATYLVPMSYRAHRSPGPRARCWAPPSTGCWAPAGSTTRSTTRS